jgi:heat-inducible transcriptional repressor
LSAKNEKVLAMQELTERQKFILALVIHEYIRSATPVGSKNLVSQYRLEISSATVRNEMAALTEMGYLRQPHTSAGRIPTEDGYRYFVGRLMHETELPDPTRRTISHQFYQTPHDVDEWMRLAASVLAHQSRAASLVTAPHVEQARLKHLELIATRGRQILMVTVMLGGEIHQRILLLDEPVPQEQLSQTADQITNLFQGKDVDSVRSISTQLQGLEKEITGWLIAEMTQTESLASGDVYLDGLTNVLAEPEFSGSDDARKALRLLEERSLLQDLLTRTILNTGVGGIQVLIGGEGTWEELRQCSIVLARYGAPGLATGTLGVLGPMRMSYSRTISTVRFLSTLLSDMVTETLVDDE